MSEEQHMVREFHRRAGLGAPERPTWLGEERHRVLVALVEEELAEFRNAGETRSLVEVADALGDLLYNVYGAAVEYGIDMEPVFAEIHRSQLSKCEPRAMRRPDGTVAKGENYRPPRLKEIIEAQTEEEELAEAATL